MSLLTHVNKEGKISMVNVSHKKITKRTAIASGFVYAKKETMAAIKTNQLQKGDVLTTAHVAGIMAAKKTGDLIPLCHPLSLDHVDLELQVEETRVKIIATATTLSRTGVEMEALTAVSVCALTIYDMCKAMDKSMMITDIRLEKKTGGKSGIYLASIP